MSYSVPSEIALLNLAIEDHQAFDSNCRYNYHKYNWENDENFAIDPNMLAIE